MSYYKIYSVGDNGRFSDGVDLSCGSDEDACTLVTKALKKGATAEVWAGTRLVRRVCGPTPRFRNHILDVLPESEIQLIQDALRPVKLVLGQTLYEVGSPIDYVYFLESGVVSPVADTGDGGLHRLGARQWRQRLAAACAL